MSPAPPTEAQIAPHKPTDAGIGNQFLVKAVNNDDVPMLVKWDSSVYKLEPGVETYLPPAAAWNWFGDPRSTDSIQAVKDAKGIVNYIGDRATEVRRLRVKYGAGISGDEANFEGVNIPDVDLFTADNEKITTVLQDPYGGSAQPAVSASTNTEVLEELVAQQQRQIAALLQKAGLDDDGTSSAEEGNLPTDDSIVMLPE